MSVTNVITVTFGSSTLVFTEPYYKYNSGMYLQFSDLDLPESYQVHFANSVSETSLEMVGTSDGVLIPDDVWQTGATIYAWVYLHPTETSAVTKYEVRIPVSGRADLPDGTEPTPSEQTVIDQAITALNEAVEQTAEDVETTAQNAQDASDSADDAQGYANDAQSYATTASNKADEASTSATNASTSEGNARTYAQNASASEGNAQTYAENASESARQARESAESISGDVDDARGYAESARQSAQTASDKADEASTSASNASGYADDASGYATTAQGYATTASNKATEASGYATTASQAKTDAESARDDAQTAQASAEASAEESATNVTHYPKIENGTWRVWDAEFNAWVDTEVTAEGENGVGISSIAKTGTQDLVDTYTITFTDGTTFTYAVTNGTDGTDGTDGKGIASIAKTSTSGLVDTYTVTFTDGTTFDYTVTNGQDGDTGATPSLSIGTVTTLESGESATATITGTDENPVLNLGIPQGEQGETGEVTTAELLKAFPTDTASGATASFTDGANLPLKSLVVGIEPVQDTSGGDPSPTNICPISGWTGMSGKATGKNLFDPSAYTASDITFNTINSTTVTRDGIIIRLPQGTYTFRCSGEITAYVYLNQQASDGSYISRYALSNAVADGWRTATVTLSEGDYLILYKSTTASLPTLSSLGLQIEVGSSATDYEPYTLNKDISIQFEQTVYGGSLNVLTGMLTVDMASLDMETLAYESGWSTGTINGYNFFVCSSLQSRKAGSINMLCSHYATASGGRNTMTSDKMISTYNTTNSYAICIRDDDYSTLEDFLATLSGVQLVYEVATPTTIQLTAQEVSSLLGDNNIFADTGDTSVEYYADPTLYISKKITEAISALS